MEYTIFGQRLNLTPTMVEEYRILYEGNVVESDKSFGKLMEYLDNTGLSENTIVIVTADHGESLGEHRIFDHNHVYYGIVHVPLIFHMPDNRHEVVEYPVMSVDIMPTVLDAVGLDTSGDMRGKSLFSIGVDELQYSGYENLKTLKRGRYKLIISNESKEMLFDVAADPDETTNIIAPHQKEAGELRGLYEGIESSKNDCRQDYLALLRSIGYAQ